MRIVLSLSLVVIFLSGCAGAVTQTGYIRKDGFISDSQYQLSVTGIPDSRSQSLFAQRESSQINAYQNAKNIFFRVLRDEMISFSPERKNEIETSTEISLFLESLYSTAKETFTYYNSDGKFVLVISVTADGLKSQIYSKSKAVNSAGGNQ